jgi:hypothetical protein
MAVCAKPVFNSVFNFNHDEYLKAVGNLHDSSRVIRLHLLLSGFILPFDYGQMS